MIILYSKSMCLFVGSGFLVSHHRLCKLIHFYGLSPLGTMSDHNWRVFHLRGDLSIFVDTRHIFSFHATVRLCWTLSHLPNPPNQTPNIVSIYQPCTHTQLNAMPPSIYNAKCHCMLSHVTCIMNITWNNL